MRSYRHPLIGIGLSTLVIAGCAVTDSVPTTSAPAPLIRLELAEDGLGDALLGLPPDVIVADISALYGEPDHDSDWIVSEPNIYGSCPGSQMRAIGWGSLLTIFIKDGNDDLGGRFYTYTYGYDYAQNVGGVDPRGLALTTAAGIGVASTVDELAAAYGASVTIDGDIDLDVWAFEITGSAIRGLVTGPTGSDTVTLLELAAGCQ